METNNLSCREARKVDIVGYLEKLGHRPQRIKNNDYWYRSPLRDEKEPSFKVNRKLNVWFDYGIGKGGNIIDLGILYYRCSVKELLERLQGEAAANPQIPLIQQPDNNGEKNQIRIINASAITHPALRNYLDQRKIPLELANGHCREVRYELYGKTYSAIGFQNNAGAYELRSPHFKGSSSPKEVTLVDNGSKALVVMEGFFSFLSYLVLHQQQTLTNFLVLNSLSFLDKSRSIMEKHDGVNLFLDRDNAGVKATQKALEWNVKFTDKSLLYSNYKDLNECLVRQCTELKQRHKLRRRL